MSGEGPQFTFQDRNNIHEKYVLKTILQIGNQGVPLVQDERGRLGVLSKPLSLACGYVQSLQVSRTLSRKRKKGPSFREGEDFRNCCDDSFRCFESLQEYPSLENMYRWSQAEVVVYLDTLSKLNSLLQGRLQPVLEEASLYLAPPQSEESKPPAPKRQASLLDLVEGIATEARKIKRREAQKEGMGLLDLIPHNDKPNVNRPPGEPEKFVQSSVISTPGYACIGERHAHKSNGDPISYQVFNIPRGLLPVFRAMEFIDRDNKILDEDARYFFFEVKKGIYRYHEDIVTKMVTQLIEDHSGKYYEEVDWRPLYKNSYEWKPLTKDSAPRKYNFSGVKKLAKKLVRELKEKHGIKD